MKLCIFGNGGFAKEVYWLAKRFYSVDAFIDLKPGGKYDFTPIKSESYFNHKEHCAIIAVGSPHLREKITNKLGNAKFAALMHDTVINMAPNIIGKGSIICAGCILTCEIELGDFAQLNLSTTIGHNVKTGKFFTTAPGVHINGNNIIGNNVYFGSNSSTKDGISICDNVTVGAGACVVNNIAEPGTYIGVPAKKI